MLKRCIWALAVLLVASVWAVSLAAFPPANGHVTGMGLAASPPNYNGHCPATIHFNGWVRASGPMAMEGSFDRSDGARGGPVRLHFGGAGQQRISDTWSLGSPGQNVNGWEQFGSGNMRTNRAMFHVHCSK